jgi:large conductance mechanosensitive channel
MPLISKVSGKGLDFNNYFLPLDGKLGAYATLADAKAKTTVLAYGSFVTVVLQFLIIAACVFLLVKVVNKVKRTEPPPPAAPTKSEELLTEIRDLLKNDRKT